MLLASSSKYFKAQQAHLRYNLNILRGPGSETFDSAARIEGLGLWQPGLGVQQNNVFVFSIVL